MDAQSQYATNLLQQGLAAAKAGKRAQAYKILSRVVELDADNAQAWLWLGAASPTPKEQESCLEKVIALDSDNAPARRGLVQVRKRIVKDLLHESAVAIEIGDYERARELLTETVVRDERNLDAWLMLSRVVPEPEDQEVCFENVLSLDPRNAAALKGMAVLLQAREAAEADLWDEPQDVDAAGRGAPTLAGDVLGDSYIQKHTVVIPEPEPEPDSPSVALWEKYDDEFLCPYCASPTVAEDKRCTTCNNPLWITKRRREKRSMLLWILFFLQAANTLFLALVPIVILFIVSLMLRVSGDFTVLIPVYLGGSGEFSSEEVTMILDLLPRFVFYLTCLPFFGSLAMLVAIYLRWPPVYYLMLIGAILELLSSILGVVFNLSQGGLAIGFGVFGAILSVVHFVLTLQLEEDFSKKRGRILFRVDKGLESGASYLLRGRQYMSNKMWALAALHFRRAAGLLPYQTDGYTALAIACSRLKDYELAYYALKEAQRVEPDNAKIAEMLTLLEKESSASSGE